MAQFSIFPEQNSLQDLLNIHSVQEDTQYKSMGIYDLKTCEIPMRPPTHQNPAQKEHNTMEDEMMAVLNSFSRRIEIMSAPEPKAFRYYFEISPPPKPEAPKSQLGLGDLSEESYPLTPEPIQLDTCLTWSPVELQFDPFAEPEPIFYNEEMDSGPTPEPIPDIFESPRSEVEAVKMFRSEVIYEDFAEE